MTDLPVYGIVIVHKFAGHIPWRDRGVTARELRAARLENSGPELSRRAAILGRFIQAHFARIRDEQCQKQTTTPRKRSSISNKRPPNRGPGELVRPPGKP